MFMLSTSIEYNGMQYNARLKKKQWPQKYSYTDL